MRVIICALFAVQGCALLNAQPADTDAAGSAALAANAMANQYRAEGRMKDAEVYYLRALKAARLAGHDAVLQVLNTITSLYIETGQISKARQTGLREALAQAPAGPNATRAKACLGTLALLSQQWPQAEELLTTAVRELHAGGDFENEAITLNNLGLMAYRQKRFEEAILRYRQSAMLARDLPDADPAITMKSTYNLGVVYLKMGDTAEAREQFQRAAREEERWPGRSRREGALFKRQLSDGFRKAGDKSSARQFDKQAREIEGESERRASGFVVDVADLSGRRRRH